MGIRRGLKIGHRALVLTAIRRMDGRHPSDRRKMSNQVGVLIGRRVKLTTVSLHADNDSRPACPSSFTFDQTQDGDPTIGRQISRRYRCALHSPFAALTSTVPAHHP
jgi:hypothetical protein